MRLVLLLVVLAGLAQAQSAQVTGIVVDPSKAALAGVAVKATNLETGIVRTTTTNESGNYTMPALPPGTYALALEAGGFKSMRRDGVRLEFEQVARIDFTMELGSLTESLDVTDTAPLLEASSAGVGQVIENKTIVTLPLNGRNYTQLALLAPGAAPNYGSRAADGISLNGSRTFQTSYLIDGVDNNNYLIGVDTGSTQALRPSIDALREFKVETANYSAEYGRAAGGVVNLTLKSGSNQFHGSLFEFLRNDKLDANDFFANRDGIARQALRRNQFGATLGGRIVPNRTFFFGSYQGLRLRQPRAIGVTVPLPVMKVGDFGSVRIHDPRAIQQGNRVPFPANVVPQSRIDTVARRLIELYPSPTMSGIANNYRGPVSDWTGEDQGDLRLDHQVNGANSLFFRFSISDRFESEGSLFGEPGHGNSPIQQPIRARSIVVGDTHVLAPTLVNELRVGHTRNQSDQTTPSSKSYYADFGIKGVPGSSELAGLPLFQVTGFAGLGDRNFTPNPKQADVLQFVDTMSWTKGAHLLRFGGDARFYGTAAESGSRARGMFTFNGQFTSQTPGRGIGSPLADFLLGQTSQATLTTRQISDLASRYYSFFINDSWKLTSKLTLNLGLRYELQSPWWEKQNRQGNFELDPSRPGFGTVVPARGGSIESKAFMRPDRNNLAPRVGFAYQLGTKTVVRAGGGVFFSGLGYMPAASYLTANVPYFVSVQIPSATNAATSRVALSTGFPDGMLDPVNARNANGAAALPDTPMSEVYQWNASVQRDLSSGLVATVSYVGSGTSYLWGLINVNDPPPGPGAVNARRPFPAFGDINLNSAFAHSTYHSLQAKAEKRFSTRFSLLSAYTWAHVLDNSVNAEDSGNGSTNPQNPFDTNAEKASSAIDIRHRWSNSLIWNLPSPAATTPRLLRLAFAGWQAGAIVVLQTGTPLTPAVTPNPANTRGPARPDRLRDGNLPRSERTIERWFDPTAFAAATPYHFGNSARNVLRAPGLANLDMVIARNLNISERTTLEFRGELFNATNTAHLGPPAANISAPQVGSINSTRVSNRQMQLGLRLAF